MKKLLFVLFLLSILLVACSGGKQLNKADLEGTWKAVSPDNAKDKVELIINGDVVEVCWNNDGARALYWYGSIGEITKTKNGYEWTSKADKDKLDGALLASQDDKKVMVYEDDKISFNVSAMGVAYNVKLSKESDDKLLFFSGNSSTNSEDVESDVGTTEEVAEENDSLDGYWKQVGNYFSDNDAVDNSYLSALILNNEMSVYLTRRGTRYLYWKGTINQDSEKSSILANINREETAKSIMYSVYNNGEIDSDVEEILPIEKTDNGIAIAFNDNRTVQFQRISSQQANKSKLHPTQPPISIEEVQKNIVTKSEEDKNGQMAIFVTNNNDFFVPKAKIQVLYKKGDQVVGTEEETIHGLSPRQTSIGVVNANYESADSYTITTDISEWSDFYKGWGDGISIEANIGENNNIVTTVKNNNNIELDEVTYNILLYKGGELQRILGPEYIFDMKGEEEKIDTVNTWRTSYDDFKIFIGDAYSMKF